MIEAMRLTGSWRPRARPTDHGREAHEACLCGLCGSTMICERARNHLPISRLRECSDHPRLETEIMKMLLTVDIPHEPFSSLVRAGTAGDTIRAILDSLEPEAVCFTEQHGRRGVVPVIELHGPSDVPRFAEPFFLKFNADCHFGIVMSPDELGKAGLGELGKRWA